MEPDNEAANLNLGLLFAEQGKVQEAKKLLLTALSANPKQAVAAYNLSVIYSQESMDQAVKYATIAAESMPEDPKYPYTLAYFQLQNNQAEKAKKVLKKIIDKYPSYLFAISLLADTYLKEGNKDEAIQLYNRALKIEGITESDKKALMEALRSL
jgi:Tfp pilus assembly protein PilF